MPGPASGASALVAAVLGIGELATRKNLKCNLSGWPGSPCFRTVQKELRLPSSLEAQRVVLWALAGQYLTGVGGGLDPHEPTPTLAEELLRGVLNGLCQRAWWIDDLAHGDADIVAHLCAPVPGSLDPRAMPSARRLCREWLRLLDHDDGVSLDDVAGAIVAAAPTVGFRRDTWRPGPGPRRSLGASALRAQRALVESIFCHSFHALGLVEVGAVGGPYEPPAREATDWALDQRYAGPYTSVDRQGKPYPTYVVRPSGRAIRRTALGRRVLGLEAASEAASASIHVGADFEVHAAAHELDLDTAILLDRVAVATGTPGDPVRRWRLEKKRWGEAIQSGLEGEALVARAVADTFALVPWGEVKGQVVDYDQPPPRWLRLGGDGQVQPTAEGVADIVGAAALSAYTSPGDGAFMLDPAKLAGTSHARVLETFTSRAVEPPPSAFLALLAAYTGELGKAELFEVEVLLLKGESEARLVMARPELASLLERHLGGGAIAVKAGKGKAVRAALAAMHVAVR